MISARPEVGPIWGAGVAANKSPAMCEVAHTCFGIGKLRFQWFGSRLRFGGLGAMEGAMPRTNLWSQSVPRVELDQRSREARLRLEQIERQPFLSTVATRSRLRRFLVAVSRESARSGGRWTTASRQAARTREAAGTRARTLAKLGQFDRSAAADHQRR